MEYYFSHQKFKNICIVILTACYNHDFLTAVVTSRN